MTQQGRLVAAALAAVLLCAQAGCEEVSHDRIDTWMTTQKGPKKLEDTLQSPTLAADLRAHAAQNLIRMNKPEIVVHMISAMSAEKRQAVLAALAPRLWEDARITAELAMPSPIQVDAKDALFELRALADASMRRAIDGYLIEWLTGGYYAARARTGRFLGATIVRELGPQTGPHLIRSAKSLLHPPPGRQNTQYQLEDPLLIGLAASGDPSAADFLLDLLTTDHNDKRLPQRVMSALYMGYVANQDRFPVADPAALRPHLERLVRIAGRPSAAHRMVDDAIRLIGAVGSPACIAPLVTLITAAPQDDPLLWVSANAALQCGKAQALVPVADALPRRRGYARSEIEGAIVTPMIALDDKRVVAVQARTLLTSKSWIARAIGIELLDGLGIKDSAAGDAEAVRKLGRDRTPLKGWWGEMAGAARRDKKKTLLLGDRAKEVAKKLDQLSKSS